MTSHEYGNDSIHVFKEHEAIRRSPELLLGSKGIEGARHTVIEIIANALDEVDSGFGDTIEITYDNENTVSVRDFGRGVPLGYNNKFHGHNWYYTYCYQNAGGKYGDNQDKLREIKDWSKFNAKDFGYLFSIGLYGIGASATQFTSDFLHVESIREGIKTYMDFKDGQPVIPESFTGKITDYPAPTEKTTEPNGTLVKWRPSDSVFAETNLTVAFLKEICEGISYVSGCNAVFKYQKQDGSWETINYPAKTLEDWNVEQTEKSTTKLGSPIIVSNFTHGTTSVPAAGGVKTLIYVMDTKVSLIPMSSGGKVTAYHNGMKMRGGVQFQAVQNATVDFLKKIAGLTSVKGEEVLGIFNVVLHTKTNHTDYNGADKHSIESGFIYNDLYRTIYDELSNQYLYKTHSVVSLVDLIQKRVQDRLELEARRKQIKEINNETKKAKAEDVEKFAPSTNYINGNTEESEIYYVEGDSAGGSAKDGRNILFQSVLPTTGKPANATKLSDISALKRQFIKNLVQLDGAGVTIPSMPEESTYDISKEKFSKHIIFTDADKDGQHIRAMIFLTFLLYKPEVIRRGKLYVCIAPLYKLMFTDGSSDFAVNEQERDYKITTAQSKGKRIKEIKRLKGIGEMNPEDVAVTCMNPSTRTLVQIKTDPYNVELLQNVMEMFGAPTIHRKQLFSYLLGSDIVEMEEESRQIAKSIDDDDTLEDELDEKFILV